MILSERMRRYGTSLDMPGDHGVTATINIFANEVEALEAKVRILEGTVKLCSDDLAKMRESMEEWREVAKLSPVDNRRRYD